MHCLTPSTSGRVSARSSADQSKMPHEINEVKFPAGTILGIMGSDKQTTIDGMRFKAKYHTVEDEIMIEGGFAPEVALEPKVGRLNQKWQGEG